MIAAVAIGVWTSNSPANAATIVRNALVSTVASRSASFTMDEEITGTVSTSVTGSGACAFSSGECTMSVNYGGALASLGQGDVVFVNSTMYLRLSGAAAATLPTPWISMPLDISKLQQSGVTSSSGNPLAGLEVLAKLGDTVTDDGVVSVNGVSLHEYTVVASKSQVQRQTSAFLKQLPSWISSASSEASSGAVSENVYVNASGDLAELAMNTSVTANGQTESLSMTEVITGYGVPVTVTIPPADQVTSLAGLTAGLTG